MYISLSTVLRRNKEMAFPSVCISISPASQSWLAAAPVMGAGAQSVNLVPKKSGISVSF